MSDLLIEAGNETPHVHLSSEKGTFSFTGKSYPENVHDFYSQVLRYIDSYNQSPQKSTELVFKWIYYNTATSKIVVKVILELKKVLDKGNSFKVKWHVRANDELMLEKGEEFRDLLGVDFEIVNE